MKKEEIGNQFVDLLAKVTGENLNELVKGMVAEEMKKLPSVSSTVTVQVGNYEPKQLQGCVCKEFERVLTWVQRLPKKNVALVGHAGTGKGTLARQVADAFDAEFYEVNAVQDKYDLNGFVDAQSFYVETEWYRACKSASEGNNVVFMFDEIDCSIPEVLKIFNEGVASREFTFPNGEKLSFLNMIIICASNTAGTGADIKYTANKLDDSTLNRYVYIEIDFDERIELAVANGDKELVEFIHEVRKVGEQMSFVPSYRDIERIACMRGVWDMRQVLTDALFKSMTADDKNIIINHLRNTIKDNRYSLATAGIEVEFEEITTAKKSKKAVK